MKNTVISPNQLHDAKGLFDAAATQFDVKGKMSMDTVVPRPTLHDVIASAVRQNVVLSVNSQGSVLLAPRDEAIAAIHPGLRGVAHYKAGASMRAAPAIILRDGRRLALLLSDANPNECNDLKQSLLENLYTTQDPDIAAHGEKSLVIPTVGGHALVAASFVGNPRAAHDQVHSLDHGNFGANFDRAGNRDIFFGTGGHDVLRVRSAVLALSQVVLEVTKAYQIEDDESLLGSDMSAEQLNIALTVAATLSSKDKSRMFNLGTTLEAMTK